MLGAPGREAGRGRSQGKGRAAPRSQGRCHSCPTRIPSSKGRCLQGRASLPQGRSRDGSNVNHEGWAQWTHVPVLGPHQATLRHFLHSPHHPSEGLTHPLLAPFLPCSMSLLPYWRFLPSLKSCLRRNPKLRGPVPRERSWKVFCGQACGSLSLRETPAEPSPAFLCKLLSNKIQLCRF